jgi:Heavy metal binding domain
MDQRKSGAKFYVCPMHSDIRQPNPANCPNCGMALLPDGTRFGLLRHMMSSLLYLATMAGAMIAAMAAAMMIRRVISNGAARDARSARGRLRRTGASTLFPIPGFPSPVINGFPAHGRNAHGGWAAELMPCDDISARNGLRLAIRASSDGSGS